MLDALAATPASANFQKLKDKLSELFELDKADLDFGIYRVLRQRHREIQEFLEKHLETTVREALRSHQTVQTEQVADDLAKAEAAAKGAGIRPDQAPRVLELREKLKAVSDVEAVADEVYSHLYTFFSRYYQEGDFLGLHRSTVQGHERYMIPYNGEEVKLVWANMDQYYIKSSELLRDYTFVIKKTDWAAAQSELPLGDLPDEIRVHFKLVEGDTEKDNRKASGKIARAFALAEPAVEEKDNALWIRFAYREHSAERNLQDRLNSDTVKTLADTLTGVWRTLLLASDPTHQPKDKKDVRTVLQKHLRAYTARHQFDYFIHKDLGGFLHRELDFYLKNEVMHLDDIEGTAAPKAEEYLSKLRAIRRCATPVVRMLAQLEDFQKKLWLKKKFVVETRYCLTLDRVPEELYPEICKNAAQWQEWEKLVALVELDPKRTPEFLNANRHLMVDTRHFSREFTLKLLASIENLDACLDGVCFHSENFQALQLMQDRYRTQVNCVYIDPPYNIGESDFAYKDGFSRSSWLSLMFDRNQVAQTLLSREGASLWISINDREQSRAREVAEITFSSKEHIGTLCWKARVKPVNLGDAKFRPQKEIEYVHGFEFGEGSLKGRPLISGSIRTYPHELGGRKYRLATILKSNRGANRRDTMRFEIDGYTPPEDQRWQGGEEFIQGLRDSGHLEFRDGTPFRRYFEDEENAEHDPFYCFVENEISGTSEGGKTRLNHLVGNQHGFDTVKPRQLIQLICRACSHPENIILDYYAGTGTTGDAVISLNREEENHRRYLLTEVGAYFESVLVPRLKKVVYSTDWKDGKPQARDTGISHAFKILRLESYEDTLNNLVLRRTSEQEVALKQQGEGEQAEYMLGYFLDVESAGSASLLNLAEFRDPFAYKLKIATSSVGETKETTVDLVETFNWLLGLKVRHIDTPPGGLVTVTGERRDGKKVLVVWRKLGADAVADNAALQRLFDKLQINPAETGDTDYAAIYVNGPHTLADPHDKIHLTEEEFHRRMFATEEFAGLE